MAHDDLAKDIEESWKFLVNRIPEFPIQSCGFAALDMHKKGYPIVSGYFHVDNYCRVGIQRKLFHYWNYDPQTGKGFDLTSGQFTRYMTDPLPPVSIWKPGKNMLYEEIEFDIPPEKVFGAGYLR